MRRTILALALVVSAACGGSSTPPTTPATSPESSASGAATVAAGLNAKLGEILIDRSGRTLYLFEADKGSSSTCYAACATYWPPLRTNGSPVAGAGVNPALLGTTKRTDGTTQVTYNGHPLYYVVTDHNPGDVTGQAVDNFGAFWYVVGPAGNKITG